MGPVDLAARGAWLLHVETGIVARAKEYFDGVERVYVSPVDGKPVGGPVMTLSTGDSLVAGPGAFVPLTEAEASFFASVTYALSAALTLALPAARGMGLGMEMAMQLCASAFKMQLRALGTASTPSHGNEKQSG